LPGQPAQVLASKLGLGVLQSRAELQ
jgi:hypothetical protein